MEFLPNDAKKLLPTEALMLALDIRDAEWSNIDQEILELKDVAAHFGNVPFSP